MAIVSVKGQTGGALIYTIGSLAGSQSNVSNDMSGNGKIRIIRFWIASGYEEIYTEDDGVTWKQLYSGAAISFPLTVADAVAQGLYQYWATVASISGNTVTYVAYRMRTSTSVYSDESLNYVNVRV